MKNQGTFLFTMPIFIFVWGPHRRLSGLPPDSVLGTSPGNRPNVMSGIELDFACM